MNIKDLAKTVHAMAIKKGWWDEPIIGGQIIPRSIGDQFANFHSEISEAWEDYRNGKQINVVYHDNDKPEGIPIELADLIIRVLDTCEAYNIDIERAIVEKLAYNASRKYRHGNKLA